MMGSCWLLNRLVIIAFNVPNPENKPEVDHIDSDTLNNKLDNLRWATGPENCNNPTTKLKKKQRREAKKKSS